MFTLSPLALKILLLCSAHFLGDFAFQSEWMVMFKAKDWGVLFWHVCMYSASVIIVAILGHGIFSDWPGAVTAAGALIVFVSHGMIDTFVKGRWGLTTKIWIDQLCHLTIIVLLALVGWL